VIGALSNHVDAGGVLLTVEHDPHDGDGEPPCEQHPRLLADV
jgi:hypothetical protein